MDFKLLLEHSKPVHNDNPRKRDRNLSIRLTAAEKKYLRETAHQIMMPLNQFILASAIPADPAKARIYRLASGRVIILTGEERTELLTKMGFTTLEQLGPMHRAMIKSFQEREPYEQEE